MERIPPFRTAVIESVCRVLGDTSQGLTGTEIHRLLADASIPDIDSSNTKWKRLFNAIADIQNRKKIGNYLVMVVTRAMSPERYTREKEVFDERRDQLNEIFAFTGYEVRADGKMARAPRATTIGQAKERASRLRATLEARRVHRDVLAACKSEFLRENYFHAVFEAMKSIAARLRNLSGATSDGADLVNAVLALGKSGIPVLRINDLATETDRGEQRGFANLLIGLFGTIRNPLAHNLKVEWPMDEQDAIDLLTIVSLVHRKLDKATNSTKPVVPATAAD